jgi:hypothetical protein
MQCSGSISKGADSHPDPSPFFGDLQGANKKKFSPSFYAYSFLKVNLQHSSKKKTRKNYNTAEIKVFLYFLLIDERIRGSGSSRPKINADPDSDPQHCRGLPVPVSTIEQ